MKNTETDFKARKNVKGGSKKGRDTRKPGRNLKWCAWQYAIHYIGNGNESYFYNNPNAGARFSDRLYVPALPLLQKLYPEDYKKYTDGREERAAHLFQDRVHKIFYGNDGKQRGRGKSPEHPENWKNFTPPGDFVLQQIKDYVKCLKAQLRTA